MKSRAIIRRAFLFNKDCCKCEKTVNGSGYKEKSIIGQTPEGYLYRSRYYCVNCGGQRRSQLMAEGKLYVYQFDE